MELLRALQGTAWAPALVVCLSGRQQQYREQIIGLGYRLVLFERSGSYDIIRLWRLRRLLARERIVLAYGVGLLASAYCWLAAVGEAMPRVLPSVSGTVIHPGPIRRLLYRRMMKQCERTASNSHAAATYITEQFGVEENRVRVIRNGIDFEKLRERASITTLRRELGINSSVPVIGFVGRNSPVKRIPRLLDVVDAVRKLHPRAIGVLVGPGLDEGARKTFGRERSEYIRFLGPRADTPALMADFDVLVLTSDSEGTPNVVLEALGLGVPVVAAEVGDVSRMVADGITGYVVPPANVEAYADGISKCLQNAAQFRANVRARWPVLEGEYGVDAMVDNTVELWREVVTARHSRDEPNG